MRYKYGEFSQMQMSDMKQLLRNKIFFLLLIADPNEKGKYPNVDVDSAFVDVLNLLGGLNSLMNYPEQTVVVSSLVEQAKNIYDADEFDFRAYRKLILDAGSKIRDISEVDNNVSL